MLLNTIAVEFTINLIIIPILIALFVAHVLERATQITDTEGKNKSSLYRDILEQSPGLCDFTHEQHQHFGHFARRQMKLGLRNPANMSSQGKDAVGTDQGPKEEDEEAAYGYTVTAGVKMVMEGVSFQALSSEDKGVLCEHIASVLAEEAGVPTANVKVEVSEGSVRIHAKVKTGKHESKAKSAELIVDTKMALQAPHIPSKILNAVQKVKTISEAGSAVQITQPEIDVEVHHTKSQSFIAENNQAMVPSGQVDDTTDDTRPGARTQNGTAVWPCCHPRVNADVDASASGRNQAPGMNAASTTAERQPVQVNCCSIDRFSIFGSRNQI